MKNHALLVILFLAAAALPPANGALQAKEATLSYVNSYLWNNIRDMELDRSGHILYCAYVNGLVAVDISAPSKPRVISSTFIEGGAVDISLCGSNAFVATEKNGIAAVDIESPRRPRVLCHLEETASSMAVKDRRLFCACGEAGLKVFGLEDPARPKLQETWSPGDSRVQMIRVDGNQVYAVLAERASPGTSSEFDRATTVALIDISERRSMREISRFDFKAGSHGDLESSGIVDIAVKDGFAYIADRTKGLYLVDVSVPWRPGLETYLPLSEETLAYKIASDGDRLFVLHTSGLSIFDAAQPGRLRKISSQPITGGISLLAGGGYVFLGSRWEGGGLSVLQMDDSKGLSEVSSLPSHSDIKKVFVRDGAAFVTHDYGFTTMDVRNPSNAAVTGEYQASGYVMDMCVSGSNAYVVTMEQGLEIVDLSRPGNYRTRGGYNEENLFIERVKVIGTRCFITARESIPAGDRTREFGKSYIDVLDVSVPSNPVRLSRNNAQGNITSLASRGEVLFAHVPFEGVFSFLDSPGKGFHMAGSLYRPHKDTCGFGSDERMAFYGNMLLVAHGDCGLSIIDTSDPSHINLRKVIRSDDYIVDVAVCGSTAYAAGIDRGIEIIDFTDIDRAAIKDYCQTSGCPTGIFADRDYVYVADTYSLTVLKKN
jgi:hypothetical protein